MPNIKGPDGRVVSFPAGTSDADIAAAFAQSSAPPQKGFLGSFADSSGLSSLGNAVLHPINTIQGIPAAVKGVVNNTIDNVKQGVQDYQKEGLSQTTRRDFGRAVPIVGPALAQAQAQSDAGNKAGMFGTLAGTVAGLVAPEAVPTAVRAGVNTGVSAARGIGQTARVLSADAPSLSLAASRVLTQGTPGELLQSALKPGVKYGANVSDSLQEALPKVIAANPDLKGVSGFASASDDARQAAHTPFQNLLDKTKDMPISSQAVADAARNSVSRGHEIENSLTGAVEAADRHAGIYDDKFAFTLPDQGLNGPYGGPNLTVGDLNDVRATKNAQLNSLLADTPADRNTVITANPTAARMKAIRDSAADTQYGAMSGLTGVPQPEIQGMQDTYGLLRDVSDIANKREPVFARHDPVTLAQKMSVGHGGPLATAFNFAKERLLNNLTNSDALVNSAVDRYQNPTATPLVPRLGALPQTTMQVGNALQKVPYVPPVPSIPVPALITPFMLSQLARKQDDQR